MTTSFAKDQADGLRRLLGQSSCRHVLVIAGEEQVDDVVDNLRAALTTMGRNTAVVSAPTILALDGVLEQHDAEADVTLVAAHFGIRALSTVAQACDDVLLIFRRRPRASRPPTRCSRRRRCCRAARAAAASAPWSAARVRSIPPCACSATCRTPSAST